MSPRPSLLVVPVALAALLACSGLATEEETVDPSDPAKLMLDARDYAGAENALKQRIRADPDDIDARILLGDVNYVRGQDYKQRWKENLGWARDHWFRAVKRAPSRCDAWRRLATAVVVGTANEDVATPPETLSTLPISQGWTHCPGAAVLGIVAAIDPPDAVFVDGISRLTPSDWSWTEGERRQPAKAGSWFVVLQVPTHASGIGNSKPRSFTYPERLRVVTAGKDIVYDDRRFPARVPAEGVTLATACPGTTWTLEGPDRYPVGRCTTRPFDARNGRVYDPAKLVQTGPSHWEHSTFPNAVIPRDGVAEDSVVCVGGAVGRLYVDTPTCKVTYDKAIPQRRSVPASSGIVARDEAHADKILTARGKSAAWTDPVASRIARGEVALGMPHHLWTWSLVDHGGCVGRGLYQRSNLAGAHVDVTCPADGREWVFRNLELTGMR